MDPHALIQYYPCSARARARARSNNRYTATINYFERCIHRINYSTKAFREILIPRESETYIVPRASCVFNDKKLISMFLISWRVASLIGTVGQKFICIFFYWNLIINASFPTRELFLSNFVERANEGSLCSRVERGEPRINDLYVVYSNAKIVAEFLFFF